MYYKATKPYVDVANTRKSHRRLAAHEVYTKVRLFTGNPNLVGSAKESVLRRFGKVFQLFVA